MVSAERPLAGKRSALCRLEAYSDSAEGWCDGNQTTARWNRSARPFGAIAGNRRAVDLAHHTRKLAPGDGSTTVDDARGALSLLGAIRVARTLQLRRTARLLLLGDFSLVISVTGQFVPTNSVSNQNILAHRNLADLASIYLSPPYRGSRPVADQTLSTPEILQQAER